jgi:hypothetical protein
VVARDSSHWSNTETTVDITIYNWQVGILEMESPELMVYPNPVTDVLTFVVDGNTEFVRIFSADGKLVKSIKTNINQVNVADLNSGNYFLEVQTDQGKYTSQIIKK